MLPYHHDCRHVIRSQDYAWAGHRLLIKLKNAAAHPLAATPSLHKPYEDSQGPTLFVQGQEIILYARLSFPTAALWAHGPFEGGPMKSLRSVIFCEVQIHVEAKSELCNLKAVGWI